MSGKRNRLRCLIAVFITCVSVNVLHAQFGKIELSGKDTTNQAIIESINDSAKKGLHFSDTSVAVLLKKIEDITATLSAADGILDRGFDTADIAEGLPAIENMISNYASILRSNAGGTSLRTLRTLKTFMMQDQTKLKRWQALLYEYSKEMSQIDADLTSIIYDSTLRNLPEDPTLRSLYKDQLVVLSKRWKDADSSNKVNLQKIGILQNRVTNAYIAVNEYLSEIDYRIRIFQKKLWIPELPVLWKDKPSNYITPFWQVGVASANALVRVIGLYFNGMPMHPVLTVLLILVCFAWFRMNIRRIRIINQHPDAIFANTGNVKEYPLWIAAMLVLAVIPFTHDNPPGAYFVTVWVIISLIFSICSKKEWPAWFRKYWLMFLVLFLIANYTNILIKATYTERWIQLIINGLSILLAVRVLQLLKLQKNLLPLYSGRLIILFIIQMSAGVLANLAGCYSLSKFLSASGVYSILTAQVLYYLVQIVIEAIYLQYEAFKNSNRIISYFDFYKIKDALKRFLYTLAGIAWFIVLARNLNFYDVIYDGIENFLTTERRIGNITFDFWSILVFVLMIWLSMGISRLILALFGTDAGQGKEKKSKWGSAVLLLRLGILAVGVLLAFAASGIPIDKLTIIIGALGVGIGFGLQNIVNNLVSGVILAFERPVQIGDVIEVGNRYGTVKEIGIRSSKLTTVDGSEVIIPNGDLLSQHIVNWTLSNRYRRTEIIIGVGYESDLKEAETILKNILAAHQGVEKQPAALVLIHAFNASSVDFRILFWCDIDAAAIVKSEVLMHVFAEFGKHNISIPFPQQDVHIKSIDDELLKKKT